MILRNKVKRNVYKFLSYLQKSRDYNKTYNALQKRIKEYDLQIAIRECVDKSFIYGVTYATGKIENKPIFVSSKNVFVSYQGYEFLKDYYSFILKLLRDLFLILVTAIITIMFENKFSNSNQNINICDDIIPKYICDSRINNNCDN